MNFVMSVRVYVCFCNLWVCVFVDFVLLCVCVCVCMCGICKVLAFVCVDFLMSGYVYVWIL